MTRAEKIDDAVASAGELIGLLLEQGPVNSEQACLIVAAAVKAAVTDARDSEIRGSAARTAAELERLAATRTPHMTKLRRRSNSK